MVGWIICVEDSVAKDKATKVIRGSREKAEAKRDSLQKRYDEKQEGRFRVIISAPISEVDRGSRTVLNFSLPEEINTELLMRIISEVDPFLLPNEDVEINPSLAPLLRVAVNEFNETSGMDAVTYRAANRDVCIHDFVKEGVEAPICALCGTIAKILKV